MEPLNRENRDDVIEIDLIELLNVIMQNLWLILFSGIVTGALTFIVCFAILPAKFESTTKIYVINKQNTETVSYQDLQAGSSLTKDYKELVMSDPVLEEVIADTGVNLDIKELSKLITVEIPTDTRIVSITVENEDPYLARTLADSIRVSASKHIKNVMDIEAVNVVSSANLPVEKSSPNVLLSTVIGYAVGLLLTIAILCFIAIMDDTVKTPDDVEKYLGVSVLGSIPSYEGNESRKKKKTRRSNQSEAKKEEKVFEKTATE